ncbi:hypothetical protein LY90DRAFT_250395 [Neocallimastix californiae]|uniref:Uncharacterized protein n=1 Tax=Neocallimastix californiae TaxID=1754190 RepID=A0A1Y2DHQ8_9FUNG|nr:hypothetical protein LY90DRAFT_250395 [Neocallimastix californiae]|eukprot:ORY58305.1 hypothetical protein LY90DRAFT_250395 [Neocallimastix californiae]
MMNNLIIQHFKRNDNNDLTKNSPNTGTCYNKNIKNFIPGFASQFQDSFFYANVIQFLLVSIMYYKTGSGRYWRILFYASVAGFIASVLENATVTFICLPSKKDNNGIVVPFLVDEIFWTTQQYSVPILNLIKLKTLANPKAGKIIKYVIFILFLPFIFFRFWIGYERMMKGYLVDKTISAIHGFAFGTIAIADLICTLSILYYVNKNTDRTSYNSYTISKQVKKSSYTILICVDVVEFFLSVFDIFANIGIAEDTIPAAVATPFQCLMSNFILILTTDALLFRYCIREPNEFDPNKETQSLYKNNILSIGTFNGLASNNVVTDTNSYF